MASARRLTGLILALSLASSLPIAAARAGCVCDHSHGGEAEAPHTCTSACTAATCPMHRAAAASGHAKHGAAKPAAADRDGSGAISCGCARQAQALISQASVAGVVPAAIVVDAPVFARPVRTSIAEAPLSLAASPPAPPPRA